MLSQMVVTKVSQTVGITVNLGQFQSLRLDCTMEANVPEDRTAHAIAQELAEKARMQISKQLLEMDLNHELVRQWTMLLLGDKYVAE